MIGVGTTRLFTPRDKAAHTNNLLANMIGVCRYMTMIRRTDGHRYCSYTFNYLLEFILNHKKRQQLITSEYLL